MIRLATLTAAFFPDRNPGKMFTLSAQRAGLDIHYFGIGEPYCIWADMKILKKIPKLEQLLDADYTHALYSDFRDVIVIGKQQEILDKYAAVGSPECFVSAEPNCNPTASFADYYPDPHTSYRFPSPGGYLAELSWMIDKYKRMATMRDRSGDDSEIWQWAWIEGWFRPVIDTQAAIWQTWAGVQQEIALAIDPEGRPRISNIVTGTTPSIIHFQGGYSDPLYGKYDLMKPYWETLYPDLKVEREDIRP